MVRPLSAAGLALTSLLCGQQPTAPTTVAKVGKMPLSAVDLRLELNRLLPMQSYHGGVGQARKERYRRQAFDRLVEQALIYLDAEQRGLLASEDEIVVEFEKVLAKAGARFRNLTEDRRQSLLGEYRPIGRRQILASKNEKRFLTTVPPVTNDEIQAFFLSHRGDLKHPAQVRLEHILLRIDPSRVGTEGPVRQAELEKIRAEILEGTSFAEIAESVSEGDAAHIGGDLGFVAPRSFMRGVLDAKAFALQPGEISPVLHSIYGVHLLRCVERKEPVPMTLAEVSTGLRADIERQRRSALRDVWLKRLRSRFPVEILDPSLQPTADQDAPANTPATQPKAPGR